MKIQHMFDKDIDRHINGVVQVGQNSGDAVEQEVREYVITTELRKHFIRFFKTYNAAYAHPNNDTGVWISGFFGSGKSHFLKMLSYLLENRPVGETDTVTIFQKKLADAPEITAAMSRLPQGCTETILFNIGAQAVLSHGRDVILDVFAKMFYNHLGFYGENLRVALMERDIEKMGRTEAFRRAFEEAAGRPWPEFRKSFSFYPGPIVKALVASIGMDEKDARRWVEDRNDIAFSIDTFVSDMNDWLRTKPEDFRLLFMVDEMGQFIGSNLQWLLSLQSIVEQIGSHCGGKVWVVCTGQEAIDAIIKVYDQEFSRIQARFATRLSLSSSSVDEVIQRRILEKTDEADQLLSKVYEGQKTVLENLFSFQNAKSDMKGYRGEEDFMINFPFVPYQFTLMQDVFREIRIHGNVGTHLSGGERSLLSGFQEAAQHIEERDEMSLAPFYLFYDTVQSFLDSTIRRVVDRCATAAEKNDGLKPVDVAILKTLYLICYVGRDIPANLENITILMADRIDVDKSALRETVEAGLNRLYRQNYISHTDDLWRFLTDEEQDVQKEIRNTPVDQAKIIHAIGDALFYDVYREDRITLGQSTLPFQRLVDEQSFTTQNTPEYALHIITGVYPDRTERLFFDSHNKVLVLLPEEESLTSYYSLYEEAEKIETYAKQCSMASLATSMQAIIRGRQDAAAGLRQKALESLKKAVDHAVFFIDGREVSGLPGRTGAERIHSAMERLANAVYNRNDCVDTYAESDADVRAILDGNEDTLEGMESNQRAMKEVEDYLRIQSRKHISVTMEDIQKRFCRAPYGWRELDIAAVAARLLQKRFITASLNGAIMDLTDSRLTECLHMRKYTPRVAIALKRPLEQKSLNQARELLKEYLNVMDVPSDGDGFMAWAVEQLNARLEESKNIGKNYESRRKYPGREEVQEAKGLLADILAVSRDPSAFVKTLLKEKDDLLDSRDDMEDVVEFFRTQKELFDRADDLERRLAGEADYFNDSPELTEALNRIRRITQSNGRFPYRDVPDLARYMDTVRKVYDVLLEAKKRELFDQAQQCRSEVFRAAGDNEKVKNIREQADQWFGRKKEEIDKADSLTSLGAMTGNLFRKKDEYAAEIAHRLSPPVRPIPPENKEKSEKKRVIYRQSFPAAVLTTESDIDDYIERIRRSLIEQLRSYDRIVLK